jgi:hypothetical protein
MGNENSETYSIMRHENSIASLIAAPLTAVSKANMSMLSGQANFILSKCFSNEDGTYQPIMVNMTISRQSDDQMDTLSFKVPLLSLLPLNNLAVEEAKLNFSLDITTVSSYTTGDAMAPTARKSVLNGRIVRENSKEEKSSAHLTVELNAKSIPLPNGLKTLIDLYSKAILPDAQK